MALSPNSRHRSRIIREMSRDLNKTNHSCASSTGSHHGTVSDSTISDFDPENEAIMSTRQLDMNFSQRLPEIRDTAKKYGRWNGGRQPDFAINTSAIGRAFPDFSQGGSSDDSMSIEVGRGAKTRQRTPTQQTRPQYSNNIDSPVVTIGDFQILSTPPMKSQAKPQQQKDAPRGSTQKESHGRRTSAAHKENIPPTNPSSQRRIPDYVSGATRTSSGEQRRTLAEIHAQVVDESDGSFIGTERPVAIPLPVKSSRFSNFRPRNSPLANSNSQSKKKINETLVEKLGDQRNVSQAQTPSKPSSNPTVTTATFNPTNQSFLLPNMPEISELVSGTFKDGTPVFTRSGRVQSRFSFNGNEWKAGHTGLDGIPVPQDEKDIFLSLQLLQEKVDALEMEKADTQRVLEDLQREAYQLQAEKEELQRRRRSDSALGMADSGSDEEHARDNQKLVAEKTKLEAQLKSLQNRLDGGDRKISNLELRLKTNTGERDQAVKQLTEAFHISEQLKSDNKILREENESLKEQLAQFVSESEQNAREWQQKEGSLRRRLQRREEAVLEIRELTREIEETHHETNVRSTKINISKPAAPQHKKGKSVSVAREVNDTEEPRYEPESSKGNGLTRSRPFFEERPQGSRHQPRVRTRSRSRSRSQSGRNGASERAAPSKYSDARREYVEDFQDTESSEETSFDETTRTIHKDINVIGGDEDRTHGSNYSSVLGHGEMERIRQILTNERAKQQARLAAAAPAAVEDDTIRSSHSVRSAPEEARILQRKSSVKGMTSILKSRGSLGQEERTGRLHDGNDAHNTATQDQTNNSNISHQRRHSENSIQGRTGTRRNIVAEEMTSAFIVPDITIHGVSRDSEHPALSKGARQILDNLARHNGHNCTVCSRVASFAAKNTVTNIDGKKIIRIEKPIPVSDRMPDTGPYEDEPTMRPASAPGLALATVMKGLQDELAHLKMELAQYQAVYNKHDMSLGMRKRKDVKTKIENLLKAIDVKADQIYALYDVLEGQKQSGQLLSEEDIEITLQSIGVDIDVLKQRPTTDADDQAEDGDEANSELDLPWEGIEDTTGTESVKGRRQSWRV